MLSNHQFIDPSIASQMHKLEQQMRRLIQTRVNIKNNHKITVQAKQRLLKYNEDERVRLRGLMERGKLAMVEYLDRQVQVVSKECIMKGRVIDNNQHQQQCQQAKQNSFSTARQSNITVSTNRFNINSNSSKEQQFGLSDLRSNSILQQKMKSSHASTNCRSDGRRFEKSISKERYLIKQNANNNSNTTNRTIMNTTAMNNSNNHNSNSNKSSTQCSPQNVNNTSIIEQYKSSRQYLVQSDILEVNQFNITHHNIISSQQQQHLLSQSSIHHSQFDNKQLLRQQSKHNKSKHKRKVSAYLNYQQFSLNNSQSPTFTQQPSLQQYQQQPLYYQMQQLYHKKITCLEQKCTKLEQQNIQLKKIIQYQQKTIQQITTIIDQKQSQLLSIQRENYRLRGLNGKMSKMGQMNDDGMKSLEEINKVYSFLCSNCTISYHHQPISTPKLSHLNQLNQYSQIHFQQSIQNILPSSSKHFNTISPQLSPQQLSTSQQQISLLTRQLLELQQSLKTIQSQNQQLKGERNLLLKKIKITL